MNVELRRLWPGRPVEHRPSGVAPARTGTAHRLSTSPKGKEQVSTAGYGPRSLPVVTERFADTITKTANGGRPGYIGDPGQEPERPVVPETPKAQATSITEDYGMAVFPAHADLLAASGITPEVAHARQYVSADTKAQLGRLGFTPNQRRPPGLVLPTWSPVKRSVAGYQLRPDAPRVDQKRGRIVRYETAAERPVVVDAHPFTWDRLGDPATPLFVTEGIRKADAAISVGLCCVSILGVWNWRGTNDKGGTTALPEWEVIALNNRRRVYIVFDSDVMTKPEVHQALARLKGFLEARGAEVFVIYLPSGDGGVKVGLDDFLAAGRNKDDLLALSSPDLRPLPVEDGADAAAPEDTFEDVPEEEGAGLLDEVAAFISRFVVFPRPEYPLAVALWVAHAHAITAFDSTPRLGVLSPEKQSGKTRLLEVCELLVPRPMFAVNCSAAALFRTVTVYGPARGRPRGPPRASQCRPPARRHGAQVRW